MTVLLATATPSPAVLAALPRPAVTLADPRQALRELERDVDHRVVVVGADVPLPVVLGFAAAVTGELGRSVLVLRPQLEVADLQELMRAGVREVVAVDDVVALDQACRRATAVPVTVATGPVVVPPRAGRVVTVFSAKGGTGKSTISTNLAATLWDGGERRVCVVDLDLEFGDVGIMVQLEPRVTLAQVAGFPERTPEALAGAVATVRPGFDVLLAPVGPGESEAITASVVREVLAALRTTYDYVVVDTPSQLSDQVLCALDDSDHHLLVTTPEMPSLKNLRLTVDMLDLLGYPKEARSVLLNRADSDVGITAVDISRATGARVVAAVPSSRDVPTAINRGVPLALLDPDHPVSQALRRVGADQLGSGDAVTGKHRPALLFRGRGGRRDRKVTP